MAAINFPPRTQGVPDLTLVTLGDLSTEYYWTGEQWLSVGLGGGGASVTIQSTPPSSPSAGDLWFDNDSGILSMYYDSTWVDVGGGDSGTGAGSVNGIVQCDGNGNFSAAVAGTDYLTSATLGSSPAAAKAWVIVQVVATDPAGSGMTIIASHNVSSVTKVIGSIYQVNFTNSVPSATYTIVATPSNTSNGDISGIAPILAPVTNYTAGGTQYGTTPTQNNFRFAAYYIGGSNASYDRVSIIVA
jgi:hypothetical protein